MTDDRWRCAHCHNHFPVPILARDHEPKCPLNPANRQTTRGWTR